MTVGDNLPDPALWIGNIPPVAGDYMNMKMEDCLSCRLAYIGPDIVSIGAVFFLQVFFYFKNQADYGRMFFRGCVKVSFNVAPGDDQGVAFVDRTAVIKGQGQVVFGNNFEVVTAAEYTFAHLTVPSQILIRQVCQDPANLA